MAKWVITMKIKQWCDNCNGSGIVTHIWAATCPICDEKGYKEIETCVKEKRPACGYCEKMNGYGYVFCITCQVEDMRRTSNKSEPEITLESLQKQVDSIHESLADIRTVASLYERTNRDFRVHYINRVSGLICRIEGLEKRCKNDNN